MVTTGAVRLQSNHHHQQTNIQFFFTVFLTNPYVTLSFIFGHFPGQTGKPVPEWILLELMMMEVVETTGAISHAKLQKNHPPFKQAKSPS